MAREDSCHGDSGDGEGGLFGDELRRLATASKHANQSLRLLSLAAVLDGMSRADAARIGGMDRQTLRDWVHRFNERGPEGLKDSWSKGHPPASRRSSWRSWRRSLKPARSAPCMESCAGAGWTCSRSWPSASASLTTSARSARSSSSSASRTSARVPAIRPRTRRPWRVLKNFAATLNTHRAGLPKGKPIEIWFQDEARIGQKNGLVRQWARRGSRPRQPADQRCESAYLFGAICPARGTGAALAMPYADSEAMQLHLVEVSSRVRRAPTPCSSSIGPAGIRPVAWSCRRTSPSSSCPRAPPSSIRSRTSGSTCARTGSRPVFETYEAIIEAACEAWRSLLAEPTTITSIGHRGWAHVGQK